MHRRTLLLSIVTLSVLAASCSAGFSRPRAQALVEGDGAIFALIDPDPNRNTESTIARLLSTSDGREWQPVVADGSLPDDAAVGLNLAGVAQECDEQTRSCYRVVSPDGGISLEQSRDGGVSWSEVWSISAGRLDFQDRCCGRRRFAILDLEYVPQTGLVAVALSEYGLLSRGLDAEVRLETLGRPVRPDSGLMVGLYVEPLFAAVLALVVGWLVTEQRLTRVRNELEQRFGSAEHTWLTSRARQAPIVLPLVFFVGVAAIAAWAGRAGQTAQADPANATGWVSLALAAILIAGVSAANHRLHRRQWTADEETRARSPFGAAAAKAIRAQAIGTVSALLTFVAALVPLILWTTGVIDGFDDAVKASVAATGVIAAGFLVWEASNPPLPE